MTNRGCTNYRDTTKEKAILTIILSKTFNNVTLSSLTKVFTVLTLIFIMINSVSANQKKMSDIQQKYVERFLFPLPQKLKINDIAYSESPKKCQISVGSLCDQSKVFVGNFKNTWKKYFKSELNDKNKKADIVIHIGTTNDSTFLNGLPTGINIDKLKNTKNSPQAYSIDCFKTKKVTNVYIIANASFGIFNALNTFEELITSMSTVKKVVIPDVHILDWPDIEYRGIWDSAKDDEFFKKYSKMKLNTFWGPFLYGEVSEDKKISYPSQKELIERNKNYNVHTIPVLVHLDYMFKDGYMVGKYFPEVAGKEGDKPFGNVRPWCFSNPKSQEVLDKMFEAIARDVGSDYFWMWPSEHGKACHCSVCKGDKHMQNIREFQHIMHAYQKALKIRPNFKMSLITTQGTRDYNLELLDYIPKSVGLDIYDGSLTYQTQVKEPILESFKPLMEKMRKQNRKIGVVPLFAASHYPGNMLFPFNSVLLTKTRMQEFKSENISRTISWIPPDIFAQEIEGQSMAEYAWNADGRSTEEFLYSWAVRKGMNKPELVVKVLTLLDSPERQLSNSMRADDMTNYIERMVDLILGKEPRWFEYFSILRGFEDPKDSTKEIDFSSIIDSCNIACELAKEQGDERLITGSKLTTQWVKIIERYYAFTKDKSQKEKIIQDMSVLIKPLPEMWEDWIKTVPLSEDVYNRRKEKFDASYKQLKRLM